MPRPPVLVALLAAGLLLAGVRHLRDRDDEGTWTPAPTPPDLR